MKKRVILNFTDYYITGVSDLTLWGGGNGCIDMTPFHVKSLEDIKANLNDAGFGVESINGAVCDVYANYEGHHELIESKVIGIVSDFTYEYYSNNF